MLTTPTQKKFHVENQNFFSLESPIVQHPSNNDDISKKYSVTPTFSLTLLLYQPF